MQNLGECSLMSKEQCLKRLGLTCGPKRAEQDLKDDADVEKIPKMFKIGKILQYPIIITS